MRAAINSLQGTVVDGYQVRLDTAGPNTVLGTLTDVSGRNRPQLPFTITAAEVPFGQPAVIQESNNRFLTTSHKSLGDPAANHLTCHSNSKSTSSHNV
jgi:hypothetical protein